MNQIVPVRTLILLLVAAAITFLALRSLRAQRLKERYVLLFVLTGVPFLILSFWPDGILWASDLLKIEKGTLLILCVTIYFILTTFALLSIVSVQDRKIDTLGQMVALLQNAQEQQREADHLSEGVEGEAENAGVASGSEAPGEEGERGPRC